MTPDERKAYMKAWRATNRDKLAGYQAKARAKAVTPEEKARRQAYYQANRDHILARTKAYQAANPERVQQANAEQGRKLVTKADEVKAEFDRLPEDARPAYARGLLELALQDTFWAGVVRVPSLDYGYLAVYSGL